MNSKAKLDYSKIGYEADPWLALQQMKELVQALNPTTIRTRRAGKERIIFLPLSPTKVALRKLVQQWFASGPNLRRLFEENPRLEKLLKYGKTKLWSAPSGGRAHLDWTPQLWSGNLSPMSEAQKQFAFLITNPQWKLLSGPCPHCNDYLLKIGRRKKYCSKTCASRSTAKAAVYQQRKTLHDERIKKAQAAIHAWNPKHTYEKDWKRWVARQTRYTVRWITRHVNEGNLTPPKMG